MSRKVTEAQKKSILVEFNNGVKIKEISKIYNFTITTIYRQLRNILGEEKFLKIKNSHSKKNTSSNPKKAKESFNSFSENIIEKDDKNGFGYSEKDEFKTIPNYYVEISPLIEEIELEKQKDISSISVKQINFPKILFMIIDNKNELEIKKLKDYPSWSFLALEEQQRNAIEIFSDQKLAKKVCLANQKLIKIPNPKVFEIASENLKNKGISRIIYEDNLLSL